MAMFFEVIGMIFCAFLLAGAFGVLFGILDFEVYRIEEDRDDLEDIFNGGNER